MFSVIKIMIKMHSTKLKMIGELKFCLENVIFITKFAIFYLKNRIKIFIGTIFNRK